MANRGYENGFAVTLRPERLGQPSSWRKPTLAFAVSMGDLFHADVPDDYIGQVIDEMRKAPRHRFQVLTKRAERLAAMQIDWPSNVWVGVSVEHRDYFHRVDCLRQVKATVRWLSMEPLLGSLAGIDLTGIDWAVVGGESGTRSRPMQADWVREVRDACLQGQTAFFFKQWGGRNKKKAGRELDGRTWDEMPLDYLTWQEGQKAAG